MAYTPVNWQTGDTITAERLNRMDRGWDYESTQLFSETVTTADSGSGNYSAQLSYSQLIDADTITVTYDGTEYTCTPFESGAYGAPWSNELNAYDFSEFPFSLYTSVGYADIATQTAGEHTVAAVVPTLQTSADFKAAVQEAANNLSPLNVVIGSTTWQEVKDASDAGRVAAVFTSAGVTYVTGIQQFTISCITTSGSNVVVRTFYANDANSPLYVD